MNVVKLIDLSHYLKKIQWIYCFIIFQVIFLILVRKKRHCLVTDITMI